MQNAVDCRKRLRMGRKFNQCAVGENNQLADCSAARRKGRFCRRGPERGGCLCSERPWRRGSTSWLLVTSFLPFAGSAAFKCPVTS